jgi:hypothetical protein
MKTNNIASYTDSLVACMRQNPIWILLAEVRSAEAVLAVRNSISSGHHILSTIHADKASSIPMRMYSLLESSQDTQQFLSSIHRYVQIGIYVKGYFSKRLNRFQREILEVCEFYVDPETQQPKSNMIYQKHLDGTVIIHNPTQNLLDYLSIGNVWLPEDTFGLGESGEKIDDTNKTAMEVEEKKKPTNGEDPFNMNDTPSNASPTPQVQTPQPQVVQTVRQPQMPQVAQTPQGVVQRQVVQTPQQVSVGVQTPQQVNVGVPNPQVVNPQAS